MSKTLVVIDKGSLQETVYLDVKKLDFGYSGCQVVEYIITDRRGAIHHYPREQYNCSVYIEIDSRNTNHPEDDYSDYIERVLKENDSRVVTPRDRLLMKGDNNDSDC